MDRASFSLAIRQYIPCETYESRVILSVHLPPDSLQNTPYMRHHLHVLVSVCLHLYIIVYAKCQVTERVLKRHVRDDDEPRDRYLMATSHDNHGPIPESLPT